MTQKEKSKNKNTVISKPRFWMKHNKLQIVTLKNRDPDILDHLFQKKCFVQCVLLHAQTIHISWHITFYSHDLCFIIEF